jgi:hypothetical protein
MRGGIAGLGSVAALVAPAWADPAPDYFLDGAFETSTAQVVARACTTLSVDPVAVSARTEGLLERLAGDGFTLDNIAERMDDPSAAIRRRQAAFLDRHDLVEGAPEAEVCAAGRREIEEETAMGTLLTEVAP